MKARLPMALLVLCVSGCYDGGSSTPTAPSSPTTTTAGTTTTPAPTTATAPPISVAFTGSTPGNPTTDSTITYFVATQHGTGTIVYGWDLSDGSAHAETAVPSFSHRFVRSGIYYVTVNAVDAKGNAIAQAVTTVAKPAEPPATPPDTPQPVLTAEVTCVDGKISAPSASTSCSMSVLHNGASVTALVSQMTWDWGDGTPAIPGVSTDVLKTHAYTSAGTFHITGTAMVPSVSSGAISASGTGKMLP